MNVVLLSGGSGKRLWPLSNEIRSKQFIRLFNNGNGEQESMLMRVHRQLVTALPQPRIVVATGRSQVSAIRNQLGDSVSICVEPCRRDTFPAIALAAAYLKSELHAQDDECVVVCPVDPYVDDSYVQAFHALEKLVQEGDANLTLMGVEPTGPSEKYGYIIPAAAQKVSRVVAFKEKPDRETALQFLQQGALWNAGVFAFKLGYLLKIAHELIAFSDYQELYDRYEQLEKISFDYAVVEKEENTQVLRYAGEWRDVGTWRMLTEVMEEPVMGKAVLDSACTSVHVVNELGIPILAMGCHDMIIAASGDGILIADKEQSGAMKPYVEKIENDVRFAEKSWGTYTVLDAQPGSMTVQLAMQAGQHMSYHSHELRSEVWTITSGEGTVTLDGVEQQVTTGSCVQIPAGVRHTVYARSPMTIVEIQMGSELSVQDKKKHQLP